MIRYLQGRSLGEVGTSKPAVVSPVDRKARRELLPWSPSSLSKTTSTIGVTDRTPSGSPTS